MPVGGTIDRRQLLTVMKSLASCKHFKPIDLPTALKFSCLREYTEDNEQDNQPPTIPRSWNDNWQRQLPHQLLSCKPNMYHRLPFGPNQPTPDQDACFTTTKLPMKHSTHLHQHTGLELLSNLKLDNHLQLKKICLS